MATVAFPDGRAREMRAGDLLTCRPRRPAAAQSVACNRLRTLEERCARWLLMTHDRVHGDSFELTHEFLALMLGVRRAGVSVAMGALQRAGMVRYSRGRVEVLDRPLLEEASCSCYHITRTALGQLLG